MMTSMSMSTKIISRRDAAARNLLFFFSGRPCCRGHLGPHYVSDGSCAQCRQVEQATAQERAKRRRYQRARRRRAAIAIAALAKLGVEI